MVKIMDVLSEQPKFWNALLEGTDTWSETWFITDPKFSFIQLVRTVSSRRQDCEIVEERNDIKFFF